jgi:hypothetical protein
MSKAARWSKEEFEAFQKKGNKPSYTIQQIVLPKADRYKNKWEREFAKEILHIKLIRGEIAHYEYEPFKIRLAEGLYIIPDFPARLPSGHFVIYEVKGHERRGWIDKWKMLKEKYSAWFDHFYVAKKVDGHWEINEE